MFKRFGIIHNCLIIVFCLYVSVVLKRYLVNDELNFYLVNGYNWAVLLVITATALTVYLLHEFIDNRKKKSK